MIAFDPMVTRSTAYEIMDSLREHGSQFLNNTRRITSSNYASIVADWMTSDVVMLRREGRDQLALGLELVLIECVLPHLLPHELARIEPNLTLVEVPIAN